MTWRARSMACLAPACLLAACAAGPAPRGATQDDPAGLRVALADVPAPAIAERDGAFTVAAGTEGLWVALPGLARAERGLVTDPATGRSLVAALFPAGGAATVSADLAARLGLAGNSVRLTVVALRQEARIVTNDSASGPRGF